MVQIQGIRQKRTPPGEGVGRLSLARVCILVHQYSYRHARVQRFAETLADAGVQVDLLCLRERAQPATGQLRGVRVMGIPVSRNLRLVGGLLAEYLAAFCAFSVRLPWLQLRNRYQLIQVHNMPDFLVFAALVPRLLGARVVLDICDPMPEFYMSKSGSGRRDGWGLKLLKLEEKLSTSFAHAITCANSNFRDCLAGRGVPVDKITVINYVPDPRLFHADFTRSETTAAHLAPRQAGAFTLIYPGTIAPRYGLEVAIRALPLLVPRIPALRLLIMGPWREHSDVLEGLVRQLGVASHVEFRPPVPVNDIAAEIAKADAGIYTALPDPHMSIAVPLKVLEYAAVGVPIITSRLKIMEDLFSDSSVMFFRPGDPADFARCVLELYLNPERKAVLVQNAARELVGSHSWDAERRRYFDLLGRLLQKDGLS